MRDRHVRVNGSALRFEFRGKSGTSTRSMSKTVAWHASFVRAAICRGSNCFSTSMPPASGGRSMPPTSMGISNRSQGMSSPPGFGTWAGTVLAARALHELAVFESQAQTKRNVLRAVEVVAKRLGNTRAVCRKCYIHPEVVNAYLDGTLADSLNRKAGRELRSNLKNLSHEEAAVLALLRRGLEQDARLAAA